MITANSARKFVEEYIVYKLDDILENQHFIDAKSRLQELSQEKFSITPTYETVSEAGPDHNKKFIVDLKTALDASVDGFTRMSADRDHHIQASFYADLLEKIAGDGRTYTFFFIAQEKKAPYAFNIFESSPQFIAQGRYEYEMLLQLYKYCTDNNTWPGYQVWCENRYGILELKLPPWAIKDLTYYDHLNHKK
jgi:hypothetical protein